MWVARCSPRVMIKRLAGWLLLVVAYVCTMCDYSVSEMDGRWNFFFYATITWIACLPYLKRCPFHGRETHRWQSLAWPNDGRLIGGEPVGCLPGHGRKIVREIVSNLCFISTIKSNCCSSWDQEERSGWVAITVHFRFIKYKDYNLSILSIMLIVLSCQNIMMMMRNLLLILLSSRLAQNPE